jgi:cysteine desulfurase/selenocysteine lyase
MSTDWSRIRLEFPSLENWTYLDSATFGQLPLRTSEAVARHFARRHETACTDFLSWFDDADEVRRLIARLIRCEASDIAFVQNVSSALSILLTGIDWKPGDRVVTLEGEFPNNIYHPALLRQMGVEFVETSWEGLREAITPNTRLVALSTVNYISGFRPPLEELAGFLRERGVILYLDGTQSIGALRFDASRIRPDVLAAHGYKWMLCPNGSGFLYVDPEFRPRLRPNVIGWRSHRGWRGVDNLHHGAPEFAEAAEKYEGGMLPFPLIYAMKASVEMILEIGPEAIEHRVLELAGMTRAVLRAAGADLLEGHYNSPIVAASFPGADSSKLAAELRARRVVVSARHGRLRVSTHFYNMVEDLARLDHELRSLV